PDLPPFPTRRSSDLGTRARRRVFTVLDLDDAGRARVCLFDLEQGGLQPQSLVRARSTERGGAAIFSEEPPPLHSPAYRSTGLQRSEEHTSELQSREN